MCAWTPSSFSSNFQISRDRAGSFEPQLVAKGQTRWHGFDDKILSLYVRGMTTREIQGHLEEIYQVEVSPTLISTVTDAVLDAVYAIVYLDALVVKMRSDGRVENRAVYVAIGITLEGCKEVLGLWTDDLARARDKNLALNFAVLKHAAFNVLKSSPAKISIKSKRKKSCLNNRFLADCLAAASC